MSLARLALAAVVSLVVLLVLNMTLFPLVFPSGVASKLANPRSEPLVALHLAAFVATAALLTLLCTLMRPAESRLGAAGVGTVAGLLAALPSALHTHAMAHLQISAEVVPVIWTTATWTIAATVAHWAYRWRSIRRA